MVGKQRKTMVNSFSMQSLQRNIEPTPQCGNDNDSLTHNEVCFSFDEDEFYIIHTRVLLHLTSCQNKHKEPENEPFPCFIANLGINAISIKFLTGPLFTCRSFLPHTVASVLLKAANSPQGFWKGRLARNLQGLSFFLKMMMRNLEK